MQNKNLLLKLKRKVYDHTRLLENWLYKITISFKRKKEKHYCNRKISPIRTTELKYKQRKET